MPDLYEEINALVDAKLQQANAGNDAVDLTEWVSQVTESLADMIVFGAPPELQQTMVLFVIARLERFVSENQRCSPKREGGA